VEVLSQVRGKCVVTGGSGFLGEAIVQAMVSEGFAVISLDMVEPEYNLNGAEFFKCDITDKSSVLNVLDRCMSNNEPLEILVNNAAIDAKIRMINGILTGFADFDLSSLLKEFEVAIKGSLICTQLCVPHFSRTGLQNKSVIFIGSDLSVIAPDQRIYLAPNGERKFHKPISYSIIKHATLGAVKYLAVELAPIHVRVNAISPGPIKHDQPEFVVKNLEERIPFGRLGLRKDTVGAVKFLASSDSAYITGQNIQVDGGRTVW